MMAMSKGFLREPEDPPITAQQEVISAVGSFFIYVLLAPIFLLQKIGVKLPHPAYADWLYTFLGAIIYGYIILYVYKFSRKR